MTKSRKSLEKKIKSRKGYHPGYSPQHCVGSGSVPRSSALPHKIVPVQEPVKKRTSPVLIAVLILVVIVAVLVFLSNNNIVDLKPLSRFFRTILPR